MKKKKFSRLDFEDKLAAILWTMSAAAAESTVWSLLRFSSRITNIWTIWGVHDQRSYLLLCYTCWLASGALLQEKEVDYKQFNDSSCTETHKFSGTRQLDPTRMWPEQEASIIRDVVSPSWFWISADSQLRLLNHLHRLRGVNWNSQLPARPAAARLEDPCSGGPGEWNRAAGDLQDY